MKVNKLFIILLIFIIQPLVAIDKLYYYEEAQKVEKISPYLSISLYETFLNQNPPKKFRGPVLSKLFDLYIQNNKIEEFIKHVTITGLDKLRKKKAEQFKAKIAKNIGLDPVKFNTMLDLILRTDIESREELLALYQREKSVEILNYAFAIKIKMKDLDSLAYIVSELTDINPSFKIIYLIKTDSNEVLNAINNASMISDLSENQKMEILYLYGMFLRQKQKYKQSAKYFRMSASYYEDKRDYLPIGILESAKSLFLAGKKAESCDMIWNKKLLIQSESDEFLSIYCNSKQKQNLSKLKSAFQVLSERDEGLIFRKYLKITRNEDAKDEE
ncbi:MAG: hypothetical protein SFU98_08680 [Leptospiraceae bacterium]|nr:hypothetical protein [Leptospiraceae bacterium]